MWVFDALDDAGPQLVMAHLAAGLTADAIAHALGARSTTVRKHLQNVYAKLVVHDRLSAVLRAHEFGLLNEEDLSIKLAHHLRTTMTMAPVRRALGNGTNF